MSYTWRSILQASWILKKGCFWTIGSGEDISLWEDNWIHQKGNASTWSIKPAETNYLKVKDIMNDHGWDNQVINQLFIPAEANQILWIPITDRTQKDSRMGTIQSNLVIMQLWSGKKLKILAVVALQIPPMSYGKNFGS
jgi:hypothetical protein